MDWLNKTSSNQLVQHLLNDSNTLVLVIDNDKTILYANALAESVSGVQLEGKKLDHFFIDPHGAFDPFKLSEEPEKNHLLNINIRTEFPESYFFHFQKSGSQLLCLGDRNRDESWKLQRGLMETNAELNNLTREIQKKNQELKKLNQVKNQFLGIAAHDLRNPINIILGFATFLAKDSSLVQDPKKANLIERIRTNCAFMLHLLNELLDISKIEAGKLELNFAQANLSHLLKEACELNQGIAAEKNIQVVYSGPGEEVSLDADSPKLEQVIHNLLTNAIKFSHPDTRVEVSFFDDDNYYIVSVRDQGQGIPREELDKLFLPFQKTSVRSTAGESSTGLGLAIVHKIIVAHGGKIWVDSTVGEGTTFFFSLPHKQG